MKWIKHLQIVDANWLVNLSVWAILLLPLAVYPDIAFPFELGRFLGFTCILVALLIGLLLEPQLKTTRAWWKSTVLWLIIAWVAIAWVASIFGASFHRSLWGTAYRSINLLYVSGLTIMLSALLLLIRRTESWIKMMSIMSWVGSVSALIAILQKLGAVTILRLLPGERVGALMGNPIFLGMLLLLTVFLTGYFFITGKGWVRWLYFGGMATQITAILLTASRGPFLGLVAGIVIFGIGFLWTRRATRRQLLIAGGWTVLLSALSAWVLAWLPIGQRLIQSGIEHPSIQSRAIIWGISWQAFLNRPWFGYGLENVEHAFNKFYQPGLGFLSVGQTIIDRAHGFLFDHLLTTGIVGTIIIVVLVIVSATMLLKRLSYYGRDATSHHAILILALLATGGSYFVSQMTAFDSVATLAYVFVLLGIIIFFTSTPLKRAVSVLWVKVASLVLLVPTMWLSINYLAPAFLSARHSILGDRHYRRGNYALAEQYYRQAQEHPNPLSYFLLSKFPSSNRAYAAELISQQRYAEARNKIDEGLEVLGKVEAVNSDNPFILQERPLALMLKSFASPNRESQYLMMARSEFEELVRDNPNREYLYLNWAKASMALDLFNDARLAIERASEISVPPQELELWRAILAMRSGSSDQESITEDLRVTASSWIEVHPEDLPDFKLVVRYLMLEARDWSTALYYQQLIVENEPDNATERIILAKIYTNLNQLGKAEAQARRALEIDPSRQTDVTEFLQST